MTRRATLLALLLLTGCGVVHIIHWDYVPKTGWRAHVKGMCNYYFFDEEGNVLPSSSGCFDLDKHLIAGCRPGYWQTAPEQAATDAKINARRIKEHCRMTALGCHCTGLTGPTWSEAQKRVYPPCDPAKGE